MKKLILSAYFVCCFTLSMVAKSNDTLNDDVLYLNKESTKINNYQDDVQDDVTFIEYEYETHDRFRIALGGGYALRLGERAKESDPTLDQMSKDLMHGYTIDGDMQYFFKDTWGIGLNVNYVKTSASGNIYEYGYGRFLYEVDQSFLFIGPSFVGRSEVSSFNILYNIGLGPLFFTEKDNMNEKYTATAFGMNAGIAGEYKLSPNLGLGLKLSYNVGTIGSLKDNDGYKYELSEKMSVSNLNITGFISFRAK